LVGLPAAVVLAPAAPAPSAADAAVHAACNAFLGVSEKIRAIDTADHWLPEEQMNDLLDRWNEALDAVIEAPARTRADLCLKARAVEFAIRQRYSECRFQDFDETAEPEAQAVVSLIRDVLAVLETRA